MDTSNDDSSFDWDDGNLDHLNGVDCEEAEEAVLDPDRIGADAHNVDGEERWALLGATEEGGDILFVVYTFRGDFTRVVTARDATKQEKRRYRQRGK